MQVPIVRPSPPSVTEPELKQLDWPKTALVEDPKTAPVKQVRKRRTAAAPVATSGPLSGPKLWWLIAGGVALVGGTALGWRLTRPKPTVPPPAQVAQPDKPASEKTPDTPEGTTETADSTPAPPPAPPPLPKKRHPTATTPPKKRPKGTRR
jgi:hypothetical protein